MQGCGALDLKSVRTAPHNVRDLMEEEEEEKGLGVGEGKLLLRLLLPPTSLRTALKQTSIYVAYLTNWAYMYMSS